MHRIDPNKLFALFEEINQEPLLDNPRIGPSYILSSLIEALFRYYELEKFFLRNPELLHSKDISIFKHKYFLVLYRDFTLLNDLNNPIYENIFSKISREEIFLLLDELLNHFVEREDYEKCVTIKQYKDFISSL